MGVDNTKLDLAYDKIKNMVVSSDSYRSFINEIISNSDLIDMVRKKMPDVSLSKLPECFDDLDFVCELSSRLNLEDDFSNMLAHAVNEESIIKRSIITKLLEYKYGNTTKEDLDCYDELLYILLTIYDSDNIIEAVTDDKVLINEFCKVIGADKDEYDRFNSNLEALYNLIAKESNHDRIVEIINDNKALIIDYVKTALLYRKEKLSPEAYDEFLDTLPKYLTRNSQKIM